MAKKNYLLLSLEDDQTKKVANIVSNDSCRKILDYLTQHEATESELAKKLNIPISTVHYNVQQLVKAGLVSADEFHYSEKGKEVTHYKLANKYIIIAPKKVTGLGQKLRGILPLFLLAMGGAALIEFFSRLSNPVVQVAAPLAARSEIMEESADAAFDTALQAAPAAEPLPVVEPIMFPDSIALWFLLGALFIILALFIIRFFKKEVEV